MGYLLFCLRWHVRRHTAHRLPDINCRDGIDNLIYPHSLARDCLGMLLEAATVAGQTD